MDTRLVFVHGRSQEHKKAENLKAAWIDGWSEGLAKSDLSMPISEEAIRFPYYGQTLFDLDQGVPEGSVADVIVRGAENDAVQKEFMFSALDEMRRAAGISNNELAKVAGLEAVEKGILNIEWVQGILIAIDKYLPFGSGATVALVTHDVYHYLRNPGVRDLIEQGVRAAMTPDIPCVVVGHSLGSVVAYNLLRREGNAQGWHVPLFLTVGSPLAVTAIRRALRPLVHPEGVAKWMNAMDDRDVVSLYPLDSEHFDVDPPIENKTDVHNPTSNAHGISGYLGDPVIARRIYDAVRADIGAES